MPIDPQLFQLYLVAAIVLVLIPGPDTLLILSRSVFEGRPAGWVAATGILSGNIVHAGAASLGISAVIAASPWLFDVIRTAGALYLAWLGFRALRSAVRACRAKEVEALAAQRPAGRPQTYLHACLTNLLNPKIILFYLAFVPQFVSPAAGPVAAQTFILGLVLAGLGFLFHLPLAALAAAAARRVVGNRWFRAGLDAVAGLLFVGFAVRILLTERRYA